MAAVPFPAFEPHPEVWLLVGLLGAAYTIAVVRVGPRLAPPQHAGGHAAAGRVLLGRAARAARRLGLADPRSRRELPVLGAHGAAPRVLDHRRAAAAARHADLDGAGAAVAAEAARARCVACRASCPPTILFNVVVVVTHIPMVVDAALHNGLIHFGAAHARLLLGADRVDAAREPAARSAAPRSRCCGCCSCSCRRSCRRSPRRS